jgi:enamine deaminase RidA (YjgF/YER057c/UK114 family)
VVPGLVDARLAALGLVLPPAPVPIASFLPFRIAQGLVFLAGQTCERDGRMLYTGRVGVDVEPAQGRQAARVCALNLLAALRLACDGDLDRVARCLRVGGFVQAASGFTGVPAVIDGASEIFIALWGEEGRHARTSIGVATLPQNASVEVDAVFELAEAR